MLLLLLKYLLTLDLRTEAKLITGKPGEAQGQMQSHQTRGKLPSRKVTYTR